MKDWLQIYNLEHVYNYIKFLYFQKSSESFSYHKESLFSQSLIFYSEKAVFGLMQAIFFSYPLKSFFLQISKSLTFILINNSNL